MRVDNPTAPARATTAPRAPNPAKARPTLPTRPITRPVQNEPTATASGAMLVSPSFPRAKPAITPRKPAENPHFARARLASISCPTLNPIDPYIHPRPRDTNHATFFPATHVKTAAAKATGCYDVPNQSCSIRARREERTLFHHVAGDSHHA
jgi:hypothetical protein